MLPQLPEVRLLHHMLDVYRIVHAIRDSTASNQILKACQASKHREGMLPSSVPGSVQPGEEVHKQDGLAKQVGQQNGQPDLGMVLQPVEYSG